MLSQRIGKSLRPNSLQLQIIVGCSFGLILGFASIRFSVFLVLVILAGGLFVYATLKRPEIALVGILIATSSIIFEDQLPMLSMGGISLHIPDILLLSSLGLVVLRRIVNPEFIIVRTPLDRPLLIFYGLTLLSTFIAIFQSSVDIVDARRSFRVLSYYLTFFIVTNLVKELRQLNFLLNSLFLLATIVAAAMVVQFFLGTSVHLLPGRVESYSAQYEDVTRILPPGWSTMLVSFFAVLCILIIEKSKQQRWLKVIQCGLMGIAFSFTFLRSYWAAMIIAFVLLGFIFRGNETRKLIKWGFAAICAIAMIMLAKSGDSGSRAMRLASASFGRLTTLISPTTYQGQGGSIPWRMIENRYALSAIVSHPIIGLGVGFTYRPLDPRLDWRAADDSGGDFRQHIHNGYLWILLQSGLLGFLSLMWLSIAFLIRGFRNWRSVANDRMKGVVLGFTIVYVIVLIAAVANSTFMQWRWTPLIGIIMGANEIILMKFGKKSQRSDRPCRLSVCSSTR